MIFFNMDCILNTLPERQKGREGREFWRFSVTDLNKKGKTNREFFCYINDENILNQMIDLNCEVGSLIQLRGHLIASPYVPKEGELNTYTFITYSLFFNVEIVRKPKNKDIRKYKEVLGESVNP